MEFRFNETQEMIRNLAIEIAEKSIAPRVEEIEAQQNVPEDIFKTIAEAGILGIPFSEEYGGSSAGYDCYAIAVEELAKVSSSVTTSMLVHGAFLEAVLLHGTEEQKEKYLSAGINGDYRGSMAFTEAGTGSDPKQLTTTAKKVGEDFILNGTKRFISNATYEGPILVYAKDADTGGCTAFIFDKLGEGYSVSTAWDKVGVVGSPIYDVFLDNIKVPASCILGGEGNGFNVLLDTVSYSKIGFCASFVGTMAASYEAAIKYAKEKLHRDKPIGIKFPSIQLKIAQIAGQLESCRLLVYQLADNANSATDLEWLRSQVSLVKAYVADQAVETNLLAMNVLGAYGVTAEYNVERFLRDSLIAPIIEGVSDVHRIIAGGYILRH